MENNWCNKTNRYCTLGQYTDCFRRQVNDCERGFTAEGTHAAEVIE